MLTAVGGESIVPRLDLRRITEPQLDTNNNGSKHQQSACFHSEFMAKVDEYSESWREAALKE